MEILQLSEEVSAMNQKDKLNEVTYSGYHCSARFRRCLTLSCYFILLCIFVMELLRSITKDGDIHALISSINAVIQTNVSLKSLTQDRSS